MRITVFSVFMIALQIALVLIYATTTYYAPITNSSGSTPIFPTATRGAYDFFIDVHVLVFFGFGIMMSCVYRSSFTAAGFSLLLASTSVLWSILNYAFWQQAVTHTNDWVALPINRDILVFGDYGAATVLVSFGAVLGRVSAAQAIILAFFEVVVYNILIAIGRQNFSITDVGGSTHVFFFGAVFGLIASAVLAKLSKRTGDRSLNFTTQTSATTAMIGTLFSWCFWPSFNAYIASNDSRATYAVVNTYLALCSSTILAFATCRLLNGKDRVQHALLATIAGGVATGTSSVMLVRNFGAILIGAFAGIISSLSLNFLGPALEQRGFPDTIGVFSAFGITGLFGTLVGIITTAAYRDTEYALYANSAATNWPLLGNPRTISSQAAFQFAYLALALGLAVVGGTIGGFLSWLAPALETTYNDAEEWVLEADVVAAPAEVEMEQKLEVF